MAYCKQNDYEAIGQRIGKLVQEKQKAYGDSFGKSGEILKILFPDGVKPEQYNDLLCITRILDKLFRIANKPNAFGENAYEDIVGYGLLGVAKNMPNKNAAADRLAVIAAKNAALLGGKIDRGFYEPFNPLTPATLKPTDDDECDDSAEYEGIE